MQVLILALNRQHYEQMNWRDTADHGKQKCMPSQKSSMLYHTLRMKSHKEYLNGIGLTGRKERPSDDEPFLASIKEEALLSPLS